MELEVKLNATEYAIVYDAEIVKVCFYIYDKGVVISGLNKQDKVVNDAQLEVSREDFLKLASLLNNF